MPDLYGQLTPQGVLNGSLQTIVYADNYNDLTNKPSINSVVLQGNKTAADLGLLTAGDIPVDSVNGKQGVVILDGDDIEYSAGVSLSDQIDNVAAAIPSVPVLSVNSKTGAVVLDGDDIEYEAGTSVNSKITDLEAEIGSGPVVSVNGQQGVVELDGTDIKYSLSKTLNQKIDEVEASIPVVSYPVTSVNTKTGDVVLDGDDIDYAEGVTVNDQIGTNTTDIGNIAADVGDLSTLTTTDKSSLVGAVNEVNGLLGWVDATSEFTKTSNFDTTQSSYFLYNDALKMYAVSFAVKANTTDNGVILSSVPKLKSDIIVLPTGFANAGGLSVTQANVIYYKANDNIVLRISTTTTVPVFVTAFLLKA